MRPTFEVQAAKRYALATGRLDSSAFPGLQNLEDGEHGVEWGTVIHMLLQVAMETPGVDLEGLARTALPEHGLDASLAGAAADTVNSVLNADIWQRALASNRRLVEVPFEILLQREASIPILVRGSIDLVFKETDGWVLVDYKTDSLPGGRPDALVDRYAPQVRLYAESWERITGEKVKEMGLYFSRPGLFEPVEF